MANRKNLAERAKLAAQDWAEEQRANKEFADQKSRASQRDRLQHEAEAWLPELLERAEWDEVEPFFTHEDFPDARFQMLQFNVFGIRVTRGEHAWDRRLASHDALIQLGRFWADVEASPTLESPRAETPPEPRPADIPPFKQILCDHNNETLALGEDSNVYRYDGREMVWVLSIPHNKVS